MLLIDLKSKKTYSMIEKIKSLFDFYVKIYA